MTLKHGKYFACIKRLKGSINSRKRKIWLQVQFIAVFFDARIYELYSITRRAFDVTSKNRMRVSYEGIESLEMVKCSLLKC